MKLDNKTTHECFKYLLLFILEWFIKCVMMRYDQVRHDMPHFEVFVQTDDRSLVPASPLLADAVREDMTDSRNQIVEAFGEKTFPALSHESGISISEYFDSRKWTVPQSVVIEPGSDALVLRKILQNAKFRSISNEESFTGDHEQLMSPGGSPQRDLVVFHDWRDKYHREIQELVDGWGYKIDDDSLEAAAELKVTDLVVHELAHLAGALSVSQVVLEKIDGQYQLADRVTAGFTDAHDDIPALTVSDTADYYTGTALDESWAALNASRYVLAQKGYDNPKFLGVENRYYIGAPLRSADGQQFYCDLSGLHSGVAGMIVEKLDDTYPGILATMTSVADGHTSLPVAMNTVRSLIPADTFNLLKQPRHSAWLQLLVEN